MNIGTETPPEPAAIAERRTKWLAPAVVAAVIAVTGFVFFGLSSLPHRESHEVFAAFNVARDWVDDNRNSSPVFLFFINYIHVAVAWFIDGVLLVLQSLGWPAMIAVSVGLGTVIGGWRLALIGATGLTALGVLNLWEESIETVGLTISAVLMAMLLGTPLGLWMGRSPRLRTVLSPVLDAMQIMPTFAYLAPMALVFSIGNPSATVATMIYAVPVSIRIASLAIQQVPHTVVETAQSSRRQTNMKVRLPMARRTLLLAVNQTTMMALSMVVITALIDADGLGQYLVKGLSHHNVGVSLEAGIAVVILAVLLDRFTRGHYRRGRFSRTAAKRAYVWAFGAGCAMVGLLATLLLPSRFFDPVHISIVKPVNTVAAAVFDVTKGITGAVSYGILNPLQEMLTAVPFWSIIALIVLLAWRFAGWRAAATSMVCLPLIAVLGMWHKSMETLVIVASGVVLTVVVGVALGVLSGHCDRFGTILTPLLDTMQPMPAIVYLVPALALFQASRFTAIVAAVVYAVPPVVRLVSNGIRDVPVPVVEAARSRGSTSRQLLWKVQLPMARRSLLLALNQQIVMVLAVVVIGGMVGAEGLGEAVVAGFVQLEQFGAGLAAGLAIVLLGITLDRVTQGAGQHGKDVVP